MSGDFKKSFRDGDSEKSSSKWIRTVHFVSSDGNQLSVAALQGYLIHDGRHRIKWIVEHQISISLHSCILRLPEPSFVFKMYTTLFYGLALASMGAVTASSQSLVCNSDNCLRELQDPRFSSSASQFCVTYTKSVNTKPSAIPTYLENCNMIPSAVSSACSCLM